MKSYTDIEQSKKLAEFLPLESADMYYSPLGDDTHPWVLEGNLFEKDAVLCWSLAALLNTIERAAIFKTSQGWACQTYVESKAIISNYHSNPVDACVEMILKLHDLKLL